MAYLTLGQARAAAPVASMQLAEAELRKSAGTPLSTEFDIFLSHSSEDADVIAGIKAMLQREALSVYVDWLEDPQLDRSRVTTATADQLRARMNHCRYLLYASSTASGRSKWMPWELGYFDGRRPGRVGILPLVRSPGDSFSGQEYLGLYPTIERLDFEGIGQRFGLSTVPGKGNTLSTMVAG